MRRPLLLMIAGVAACNTGTVTTTPAPRDPLLALVGVEHPPRDPTIVEQGSLLVDEGGSGRWVIAELIAAPAGIRALVLDEIVKPGTPTTARWRTVAVQRIEPADSLLTIQLGTCTASGRPDRAVVGLGTATMIPAIRRAWRVDTVARRFERIDATTVKCEDVTRT